MLRTLLISIALTVGWTGLAAAADDANERAIKARRGDMQLRDFNAGPLFAMAKGKMDYDAALASTLANNLKLLTQMNNGAAWPQGSDNKAYAGKTRAKPEIWTTWPAVGDAGKAFKDAVTQLAGTAGNGVDALRQSVRDLGKSCQGCHDDFRAEDF